MDGDLYDKPYEYNPFRFANMRSENIVPCHEKFDATDISDTFLGWRYGRHAWPVHLFQALTVNVGHCHFTTQSCKDANKTLLTGCSPGRWFAVQNLKLAIAYITFNYGIKPIGKRPESVVFGDANVPSASTCIKVRRRKSV